jgi:hypothetical protein
MSKSKITYTGNDAVTNFQYLNILVPFPNNYLPGNFLSLKCHSIFTVKHEPLDVNLQFITLQFTTKHVSLWSYLSWYVQLYVECVHQTWGGIDGSLNSAVAT